MNDKLENDIYNLFKSAGCSDMKCKEVVNLISDDDLSCVSGGKINNRKEIVKKILSLGLMATSVCPTVLFNNNTYANSTLNSSNEEHINENILKENQEQNQDNNININLKPEIIKFSEDLNSKKNEDKSNKKETSDHVIQDDTEFNKNKTKSDYINVNKNQAIKYYNRNSRWNTVKKAAIGTGTIIGIPVAGWLLYNNFFNTNGKKKLINYDIIIQNFVNNLNISIRSISEILDTPSICKDIINSYSDKYKFDVSDMVDGSQQDLMSSRVGIKNNLNTFSNLFHKVICNWNELNTKLNNFDSSIVFDISNDKPISFQNFMDHVEKFRVNGEHSYELKEFYKIIKDIKNIKQTKVGPLIGFKKSVLDLKIVFCSKKLHVNTQYSGSDDNIDNDDNIGDTGDIKYDDYKLDSNLADLLGQFRKYYLQILSYVAPGIRTNSVKSISNTIEEFKKKFEAFKKSKNWKGLIGFKKYEYNLPDKEEDPYLVCYDSYDELVKLINLNYVEKENRKDISSDTTEFYNYLNKFVCPAVESIKQILELYDTVDSIQESYDNSYVGEQLGGLFTRLNHCTKILYDQGYKNDANFKQFKEIREKITQSLTGIKWLI